MTDKEIIAYWKEGYTVEQIIAKNPISKKLKDDFIVRYRVERVILNFYKEGGK